MDERRGALASTRDEEKARGDEIGLKKGVRRVGLRNKTAIVHDGQDGRMLRKQRNGTQKYVVTLCARRVCLTGWCHHWRLDVGVR